MLVPDGAAVHRAASEYASASDGAGPPTAGGTRSGYDQAKAPVCWDTCQVDRPATARWR